jgi:sulfate transport system substrate-binding protein
MNARRLPRPVASLAAVLSVLTLAVGCSSGGGDSAGGSRKLDLVAYSTPQEAYDELIPAFGKTEAGDGVKVSTSFGASGAQSRAVVAGQPADVVEFSLETDVTRLVDEGLVAKNWNANRYRGMVTDSVVVLVVRKGNPEGIRTWADLARPGVKVVTPNPFSSGSARWNLMGAYGAAIKQGKTPGQALAFVKAVLKNTVAQPESGAKATAAFTSGTGDVLISYENEALEAQRAGQAVDYVIPDQTLLIENPIATLAKSGNAEQAKAFVDFLHTEPAQKIFAEHGYRPVVRSVLDEKRFPTPAQLFTIRDLGGWPEVAKTFFDTRTGSITKIENELGVSGG